MNSYQDFVNIRDKLVRSLNRCQDAIESKDTIALEFNIKFTLVISFSSLATMCGILDAIEISFKSILSLGLTSTMIDKELSCFDRTPKIFSNAFWTLWDFTLQKAAKITKITKIKKSFIFWIKHLFKLLVDTWLLT